MVEYFVHGVNEESGNEFKVPVQASSEKDAMITFLQLVLDTSVDKKDDESASAFIDRLESVCDFSVSRAERSYGSALATV